METGAVIAALRSVDEPALDRLGPLADRVLAGHAGISGGARPSRTKAGRGLEFLEYRAYAPGDDPRALDWRATARFNHPLVRQFADEAFGQWFVCLDRSASMAHPEPSKWLLALQLTAAVAYLLIRGGNQVGLLTFDGRAQCACSPGRGRQQYLRILSELASARPRASGGGSDVGDCARWIRRRSWTAVVSDFLAPDAMTGGLDLLGRSRIGVQAFQVLSRQETQPTASEPRTLVDSETGARLPLDPSPDVLLRSQERCASLQAALAGHCERRGIRLTQCLAEEGWSSVLLRHLAGTQPSRA